MLRQNKDDVVPLNNLAYLLASTGSNGVEALSLIDQAVALMGPVDELLDTRATVYLCQKQGERAAQDLEQAIAQRPTPDRLFHLSQAELQRGRIADAQDAYRRAQALGLTEELVHPLERASYRTLTARFDVRQPGN
jgi:hypothetical protein